MLTRLVVAANDANMCTILHERILLTSERFSTSVTCVVGPGMQVMSPTTDIRSVFKLAKIGLERP